MKTRKLVGLIGMILAIALLTGFILRTSLSSVRNVESSTSTFVPSAPEDDTLSYLPVAPYDTSDPLPTPSPTSEPTGEPTPSPTSAPTRAPGTIVVDHTSVDDFDRIPDEYIAAAQNLRMLFIDASVGNNISEGLDCLAFPSDEQAPGGCTRSGHVDPEFVTEPESWSRAGGYDRSNWTYQFWPDECGGWYGKTPCFLDIASATNNQYDVYSPQFSYLEVTMDQIEGSIADPDSGYFASSDGDVDVHDLEAYIAQHPEKTVIFTTTSLARSVGTEVSESFNNQMRDYVNANGHVLFDIADIVSHDPDGNPCYDNRDGVPYTGVNDSENYPDDGQDLEAICQHYTVEVNAGHLGNPSIGKIRAAKAFWVLMAQIAGWDGTSP